MVKWPVGDDNVIVPFKEGDVGVVLTRGDRGSEEGSVPVGRCRGYRECV